MGVLSTNTTILRYRVLKKRKCRRDPSRSAALLMVHVCLAETLCSSKCFSISRKHALLFGSFFFHVFSLRQGDWYPAFLSKYRTSLQTSWLFGVFKALCCGPSPSPSSDDVLRGRRPSCHQSSKRYGCHLLPFVLDCAEKRQASSFGINLDEAVLHLLQEGPGPRDLETIPLNRKTLTFHYRQPMYFFPPSNIMVTRSMWNLGARISPHIALVLFLFFYPSPSSPSFSSSPTSFISPCRVIPYARIALQPRSPLIFRGLLSEDCG